MVGTPFEGAGSAGLLGILRLRKCFAFAKHLLRSGRQSWGVAAVSSSPNQENQQSKSTIGNSFSPTPLLRGEMNFPWQSG
jgi:hypothetical protein